MRSSGDDSSPLDSFGLSGQTLAGRFRVDEEVGEGGFAVVYRGQQLALDVPVAIKVLKMPPTLDEGARAAFLETFVAEAKVMARLQHPAIAKVLDTGVAEVEGLTAPWIALEWLEGTTLSRALTEHPRYTPKAALELLEPVIEGLAYAHAMGVAHRDVKPGNIMLVPSPLGIVPKLLDFGVAKIMAPDEKPGSGQTRTRSRAGGFSPAYAAPEQVAAGRSGPWTDVHATALILTELIVGKSVLARDDVAETLREVLAVTRPTPARFGVDVGPWEAILAKALAFRPDARQKDAAELRGDLRVTVEGAEVAYAAFDAACALARKSEPDLGSARRPSSAGGSGPPAAIRPSPGTAAPRAGSLGEVLAADTIAQTAAPRHTVSAPTIPPPASRSSPPESVNVPAHDSAPRLSKLEGRGPSARQRVFGIVGVLLLVLIAVAVGLFGGREMRDAEIHSGGNRVLEPTPLPSPATPTPAPAAPRAP